MLLTETQSLIRDAIRSFAQAKVRPRAREFEEMGGYPAQLFLDLAQLGLMGMSAPAAFGGAEADYVSYALALIELAAADGALSTIVSVHNAPVLAALLQNGNEDQIAVNVPPLCAGNKIGAFALTEAGAGSDAVALKMRAKRTSDGYVLNGTKQFITSGRMAGLLIVFAVTDPAAGKRGITAFLVPSDTPGFHVSKVEEKLGQKASDTCALHFDDATLPLTARLGAEGDGYRIALANLETGRIGIAAQSVGMAQSALEIAIAYAKERMAFGKAIFEHQAVGHRLAECATRLEAARQLVLYAAALKDSGQPCLKEASMAKLFASEIAETVSSAAIQTLGGYGYLEEYGVAKIYRDVRVSQIYEGTSDVQRIVIARAL